MCSSSHVLFVEVEHLNACFSAGREKKQTTETSVSGVRLHILFAVRKNHAVCQSYTLNPLYDSEKMAFKTVREL